MTDIGVAGEIETKMFFWTDDLNHWLRENADTEIVDIKLSGSDPDNYHILVIYRKDS